jgi:uncharacterized protein YyaL (SSP411 family)
MRSRATLVRAREARPRPERDDKILTAWNGMMIAALARAARVLDGGEALDHSLDDDDPGARHLRAAERAAAFIEQVLWDPGRGVLLRRYRRGHAAIEGFAEDYACLVWGLLELFQASGRTRWLTWACHLQSRLDELFGDGVRGGWYSTTGRDPHVLVRAREQYDGAEPSASSVAALNALALARLTGERRWHERAEQAIASCAGRLRGQGRSMPLMAAALATALAPGEQIVVVGPRDRDDTRLLWRRAQRSFRPFTVMIPVEPGDEQAALAARLPWIGAMRMVDGRATAYVCRDFVCMTPATGPEVFG